ncbi:MAG: GerMN domain-containing protein [Spirochaetales bacterium]|nr:GerMN domain-containing protein [Spirochaetales bacterium]
MKIDLTLASTQLARRRVTIALLVALGVCLAVSLIVFLLTPQWTRRVFFFPEVNSIKYAAEIRDVPPGAAPIEDIRNLLSDLLLGPSNLSYAPALPPGTKLVSAMLDGDELYVGFSKEIYQGEGGPSRPREMLQGVADTIYFNFPWVSNIRFFINGKELQDGPVLDFADRKIELARALIPAMADLSKVLRIADRNPLFAAAGTERDAYLFHGGARWDERILK